VLPGQGEKSGLKTREKLTFGGDGGKSREKKHRVCAIRLTRIVRNRMKEQAGKGWELGPTVILEKKTRSAAFSIGRQEEFL